MAIDPVCGMQVNVGPGAHSIDYADERYYFCSQRCREKFQANPAAYLHGETPAPAPGIAKPILFGSGAFVFLLAIYFGVVGLISGVSFALGQFATFWYFIVPLALGFGIQVGLYTHLRNLAGQHGTSGRVVAVSGTTSTAAMVSCCTHYLVNILPILSVTGFLTVVAEYQIELFWVGLAFNAAGIAYVASKVVKFSREHKK